MTALVCDICGGRIEMQSGGTKGICESCGMSYSADRLKEIYSGMKVSITGTKEDVEQWKKLLQIYLEKCDFISAEQIVKKILEFSPTDQQAIEIYNSIDELKYYEVKNGVLTGYHGVNPSISLPMGIKGIAPGTFSGHKKGRSRVENIVLPNSVTKIEESAFESCWDLKSITIPYSVTQIGQAAFSSCYNLTEVIFSANITEISASCFHNCNHLQSITIPASTKKIGQYAFAGCTSLKKIIIPVSVDLIEDGAFSGCSSLSEVTLLNQNTQLIGSEIFEGTVYGKNQQYAYNMHRGLCRYCGGSFQGIFNKVCSKCGKRKDY